ncbi:MAG TPA: amino acid permease [Caulobacteraceae bacterium]|jgi:arginine:agmatine antiporter|nr:amino acid permease [Caulobacteraceae bacterium]
MSDAESRKSESRKIGPLAAGALVASNMIGSGVFLLPTTLAAIGSISLIGWLLVTAGIIALGLVFAALARLRPNAAGLVGYVREGTGSFLGFGSAFLYWFSCWAGLVGIAVAAATYLGACFPVLNAHQGWTTVAILAVMTLINLVGAKVVSRLSGLTIILGLAPVIIVGIAGWFYFKPEVFLASWNVLGRPGVAAVSPSPLMSALTQMGVSTTSAVAAVAASLAAIAWAFLGVESAAVVAKAIRDPEKNVAPATIGGVLFASVVYICACTAVTGVLSAGELAKSTAPFADVVGRMWGPAIGVLIAACASAKAIGAVGGWILVTAETAETAAETGLFPRFFLRKDLNTPPRLNLAITFVLMMGVILVTLSPSVAKQFNTILLIAVLLSVIVYALACISLLRTPGARPGERVLAVIGLVFSGLIVLTCDYPTLKICGVAMVVAVVFYLVQRLMVSVAPKPVPQP